MAAAVAGPLAAGGEEAAASVSLPGSPGLPGSRSAERALEEAVATGTLNLSNRRLKHFPRGAARSYDLSDITQADLSRNRFPEVPEAACQLVSLEGLSLYHNCLKCLNPALGNLTALTYLNLSRNQLSSLPPYICQLPLRVLIISNNKLGALPPDISTLGSLRQLDVSSNELQSLPVELCSLRSLRDLNVRRNQLSTLPSELSLVAGDVEKPSSSRREEPAGEERRRPDTLQLWQERERKQQQQSGGWGSPRKDSVLKRGIRAAGAGASAPSTQATCNGPPKSSTTQLGVSGGQGAPTPPPTSQDPLPVSGPVTAPVPRPLGSIQRPNSFLFRSSSQSGSSPSSPESVLRPRPFPQEKELISQLRQVLESRLQQPLPEDLAEALANGVLLCQLANQLRPRSVPFIHVPSPAVPKLSALKSRKNVESFLEACRKMGVPEESLCQPHHILEEEGAPGRGLPHIAAVLHALLEQP